MGCLQTSSWYRHIRLNYKKIYNYARLENKPWDDRRRWSAVPVYQFSKIMMVDGKKDQKDHEGLQRCAHLFRLKHAVLECIWRDQRNWDPRKACKISPILVSLWLHGAELWPRNRPGIRFPGAGGKRQSGRIRKWKLLDKNIFRKSPNISSENIPHP